MKLSPVLMVALAIFASGCAKKPPNPQIAQGPAQGQSALPVAAAAPDRQWTAYRAYSFNQSSSMVAAAAARMSADIAADARDNPAARFRVAGYRDEADDAVNRRRIEAVRNSLV